MKYNNIKNGIFKERPNRFISIVNIDGKDEVCHVKNTGRCKELLIPGVKVIVNESDNENRKTKYDLVSVYKEDNIVNIDSQAPNKLFYEWVLKSDYFKNIKLIKSETQYRNSRFDFYIETDKDKIFIEVKGVTLEENGIVAFPDAPTLRGIKHLNELCSAICDGYKAYIFFVVQLKNCHLFVPNRRTHKDFADALMNAHKNGVKINCVNCVVDEENININDFIDFELENTKLFNK